MLSTDHLIVGAGAMGMAFADTLLAEAPDVHITLVDAAAQSGGHWLQAYPFVTLHQPSAFYGVNSRALGTGRIDVSGLNAGMYELATGAELRSYYEAVLRDTLLASGRVQFLPMTRHQLNAAGEHLLTHVLSGQQQSVSVRRKWVDAAYTGPSVPATHTRRFEVAAAVACVSPSGLAEWGARAGAAVPQVCVLGAGKTAMDAINWLLGQGMAADAMSWVMPRDSWLINRQTTQPGEAFFALSVGGQAKTMAALAEAADVNDLFLKLEAAGQMLRIDPSRLPTMFHFATVSEAEVAQLATVQQVLRHGRVSALDAHGIRFANGHHQPMPANTLYVDCTASAVEPRPMQPMFQGPRIVPQLVRAPLPTFSAALVAYVEAQGLDDAQANALCQPVPFPHRLSDYPATLAANLRNQGIWGGHKALRQWMLQSRLDGFGKLVASVQPQEADKIATLMQLRATAPAAMANAQRLMSHPRHP